MPKRAATNELNHNNWNQEEEPEEECTTPQIASPEVLSKRIIKTGRRRITGSSSSASGKSAFSDFAGFGSTNSSGSEVKSPFSFLSNSNSSSTFSNANGISTQKTKSDGNDANQNSNSNVNRNQEFLSKLKSLNESVLEWIKIHVSKNPTCILTPIFSDYEKYLKELQLEKESKEEKDEKRESGTSPLAASAVSISSTKPFFSNSLFSSVNDSAAKEVTPKSDKSNESSASLMPGLNPLSSSSILLKHDSSKSLFTLPGSSGPLGDVKAPMFANSTFATGGFFPPPTTTASTNQEDDADKEDEAPPKNEFERVVEKDAVFSQRVKLFIKKKDSFADNGVGTFYIKPVDEQCSKYQAIVRADTNLGNILLNIILNDTVPSKRVGKNNVMIASLLEVDKALKLVPTLLRVKTEADADNLLEQINKYKKPT